MFPQTTYKRGLPWCGSVCIIAACIMAVLDGLLHAVTVGSSLTALLPEVIMHAQKNDFNENV